jgi:hypothetical protein
MSLLGQVDTETGRAFIGKSDVWYPLGRPRIANLAAGDATLTGFNGCFTDGQYGYFIPAAIAGVCHGKIARIDLRDFSTVTSIDLTTINPAYIWYLDGVTDGRYGYAAPHGGDVIHGYLVRFDMIDFTTGGVTVLDLAAINANYKSFNGCALDSRYLYLCPFSSSTIIRVDTNNFAAGGVTAITVTNVPLPPPQTYSLFKGLCLDGRYGYICSAARSDGKIVRFDTLNFDINHFSYIDLTTVDADMANFGRPFTDFRYVYVVPATKADAITLTGKLARIDINNFTASGVTVLDLGAIDAELVGFNNGFCDGRYAYITPDSYGKMVRIDLNNFTPSGVEILDLRTYDAQIVSCRGGFLDKTYAYIQSFRTARTGVGGSNIGKIARIVATGYRSALG